MNYLTTSFREFIKNELIKETKKEQAPPETKNESRSDSWAWHKQMEIEFNKLMADYDDLYK